MRIGKLRHRVTLQASAMVQDQVTGEMLDGWADVATVWASVEPLSAKDLIAAQAGQSEISARITMRYRADVSSAMRIAYRGQLYDIEGVLPDPKSGREYITLPVSMGAMYAHPDYVAPDTDSGGSGGPVIDPPENPNLVPVIDFTQWAAVDLSPMASVSVDSFTNSGTGYIQLDIGAEAGTEYTVSIDQTRGAGALRIYLAESPGTDQPDDIVQLGQGAETISITAGGPWLTFRASVGNTTTIVSSLEVTKAQ